MSQRTPGVGRRGILPGLVVAAVAALAIGPAAWSAMAAESTDVPDLRVDAVSLVDGPFSPGDTITHAISVSNVGAADAHDVVVVDALPDGVALAVAPAACADGGGSVTCGLGTLPAGTQETIELTVTVGATTCGDLSDLASVSASDEPSGNVDDANHDSVTDTVTCGTPVGPDLVLTVISDATDALTRGQGVVYTLTVRNVGDAAASRIHVHDDVPPGLHIMGALPTMQRGACSAIGTVDSDGNEVYAVDCARTSLAAGASATVTIRVRVGAEARCGRFVDTASVDGANEVKANRDAHNRDSVTNHLACEPSITLDVRGPTAAHVGDVVTYTLRATNDGEGPLIHVRLRDAGCDGTVTRTGRGHGDDALVRGETWMYACVRAVGAADGDPVRTAATVNAVDRDGHRVHATARRSLDVLHPAITIVVTPSTASGAPGSRITFSYAVTNTGDAPLLDVRVEDDVLGDVGVVPSIRPSERRTLTASYVLPPAAGVMTNVGTASGRDTLGASVSRHDEASVTVLAASSGGSGRHGGGAFTGAETRMPAAVAATLLLLGIGATAVARGGRRGGTEM